MARISLTRHWKFRRLARALGSKILARGVLELLWETAYEAADSYIGAADDIADAVDWRDDPGVLVDMLTDCGFLDTDATTGRHVIHDLWSHAPKYVRLRWSREHPDVVPPWKPQPVAAPATDSGVNVIRATQGHVPAPSLPLDQKEQRRAAPSNAVDDLRIADLKSDTDHAPVINARVLARLSFDLEPIVPFEGDGDCADALKWRAARYSVPYDGASVGAVIARLRHARPMWFTTPVRAPAAPGRAGKRAAS